MHEEALDSTYERVSEVIPSESREDETSTSTGIFVSNLVIVAPVEIARRIALLAYKLPVC